MERRLSSSLSALMTVQLERELTAYFVEIRSNHVARSRQHYSDLAFDAAGTWRHYNNSVGKKIA